MNDDRDLIEINSKVKVEELINHINNKEIICNKFKFSPYELRNYFFERLNINVAEFEKKWYIYDEIRKMHISESHWDFILISTIGLVAYNPIFKNKKEKIVFASCSQYEVMMVLFEKIEMLKTRDDVYDVDSYNYEYLSRLTTGLFHNIVFYLEVFAKAYLSLNNKNYKFTHNLKKLLKKVKEVIFSINHNDTVFHAYIYLEFQNIINTFYNDENELIESSIKYNDSVQPKIMVDNLKNIKDFIEISHDFIIQFFYDKDNCLFLEQGLFNRLISNTTNDLEKKKRSDYYKFLIDKNL